MAEDDQKYPVDEGEQEQSQSENVDRGGIESVSKKGPPGGKKGLIAIIGVTAIALVLVNWQTLFGDSQKNAEPKDSTQAVGVPSSASSESVADLQLPEPDKGESETKPKPDKKAKPKPPQPPSPRAKGGGKDKLTPAERKRQGGVFAHDGGSPSGGTGAAQQSQKRPDSGPGSPGYERMMRQVNNAGGTSPGGAGGGSRGGNNGGGSSRGAIQGELEADTLKVKKAKRLDNPTFTLTKGHFLDCALETAISSDVTGQVSCRLTRDVYSTNGKLVVLDRGSRIVGRYKGGMTKGQARLFVIWTRVETPKGVIMRIQSPGTGQLGRAGLGGRVDRHFWQRFGGAILVSVIDDAGNYLANKAKEGDGNTFSFGNTQQASQGVAKTIVERQIDIPPTLEKNQGDHLSIFVARDLDFSTVYDLRLQEGER